MVKRALLFAAAMLLLGCESILGYEDVSVAPNGNGGNNTGGNNTGGTTNNGGGVSMGGGTGTFPPGCDDFERPNSLDIGNGWLEKNDAIYSLLDGELAAAPTVDSDAVAYLDDVDLGNVEVQTVVRVEAGGVVTLFARAPQAILETGNPTQVFLSLPLGTSEANILRSIASQSTIEMAVIPLNVNPQPGDTFRLTMSVTGMPIVVAASVEKMDTGGMFSMAGQVSGVVDSNSPNYSATGTVGVTRSVNVEAYFDDFCVSEL